MLGKKEPPTTVCLVSGQWSRRRTEALAADLSGPPHLASPLPPSVERSRAVGPATWVFLSARLEAVWLSRQAGLAWYCFFLSLAALPRPGRVMVGRTGSASLRILPAILTAPWGTLHTHVGLLDGQRGVLCVCSGRTGLATFVEQSGQCV